MKPHVKLKVPIKQCKTCKETKTLAEFWFIPASRHRPGFHTEHCMLCLYFNNQRNDANRIKREARIKKI